MEGGDVQVWGLRVPSQPCLSISCANPKFLSLCCVLGLRQTQRWHLLPAVPQLRVPRLHQGRDQGDFSGMLQGMGMVGQGCSGCGCYLSVSKRIF